MAEEDAIVGRHIVLGFESVDATPDLHEQGPITVRVTGVAFEGSPPTEKITALVLSPPEMVGLTVTLETRYEGEPIASALGGAPVSVTAFFTDGSGTPVAGGLGSAKFAPKHP